jgi:chemotaxis protein methyltransferase CheR
MQSELERASGLPLTSFRSEHVSKQVARACRREAVADDVGLARALRRSDEARTRFRRSVAISHASMFRDPEQFALLEETLLPRLLTGGARVTAWSAGCADGSELYTLGVVLERLGALQRALLLGSDLLAENVALARAGSFAGVSEAVRARVRWEQRDVVADGAPGGRWRLVLCRNVAIYLQPAARARLYSTLVSALARHGVLLLGRSERLVEPAAYGLRQIGPHAYERLAC